MYVTKSLNLTLMARIDIFYKRVVCVACQKLLQLTSKHRYYCNVSDMKGECVNCLEHVIMRTSFI